MGPDRVERLSCPLKRVLLVREHGQTLGLHRADIAKRAGVHRSTVSLALRDHPRISVEDRRSIQALAR